MADSTESLTPEEKLLRVIQGDKAKEEQGEGAKAGATPDSGPGKAEAGRPARVKPAGGPAKAPASVQKAFPIIISFYAYFFCYCFCC